MKNIIIKHNNTTDCTLMLHACPNGTCKFQWYISNEQDMEGRILSNQIYESFIINSSIIDKLDWEGKYVYCVINQGDREVCTEYIRLSSVFEKAMEYNTFDDVSMFDDTGMIISYA